jgi:hypothetical protein
MPVIVAVIALSILAGCSTPPKNQKGGNASTVINGTSQSMTQPENPDGKSAQTWEERRTLHRPDGIIEIFERKASTEIGGAQDFAKIMKAWASAQILQKIAVAFGLLVFGFTLIYKGWPFVGGAFLAGGITALITLWWVGVLVAAIGVGAVYGYKTRGF